MDRFRQSVGGIALAAILTTGMLLAGVWEERDVVRYEVSR